MQCIAHRIDEIYGYKESNNDENVVRLSCI